MTSQWAFSYKVATFCGVNCGVKHFIPQLRIYSTIIKIYSTNISNLENRNLFHKILKLWKSKFIPQIIQTLKIGIYSTNYSNFEQRNLFHKVFKLRKSKFISQIFQTLVIKIYSTSTSDHKQKVRLQKWHEKQKNFFFFFHLKLIFFKPLNLKFYENKNDWA